MYPRAFATHLALVLLPLALGPSMAMTIAEVLFTSFGNQIFERCFLPCLRVQNGCAETFRRRSAELLKEIRKRFFHAGWIFDFYARHFQSQSGKAHCHPMIVVRFDLGPMQRAGENSQSLPLFDYFRATMH